MCALWKAAAKKYGLPFGMTEHLGASFAWWRSNKGADAYGPYAGIPYDGNDPAYRDFYHDNYEHVAKPGEENKWVWLTKRQNIFFPNSRPGLPSTVKPSTGPDLSASPAKVMPA